MYTEPTVIFLPVPFGILVFIHDTKYIGTKYYSCPLIQADSPNPKNRIFSPVIGRRGAVALVGKAELLRVALLRNHGPRTTTVLLLATATATIVSYAQDGHIAGFLGRLRHFCRFFMFMSIRKRKKLQIFDGFRSENKILRGEMGLFKPNDREGQIQSV